MLKAVEQRQRPACVALLSLGDVGREQGCAHEDQPRLACGRGVDAGLCEGRLRLRAHGVGKLLKSLAQRRLLRFVEPARLIELLLDADDREVSRERGARVVGRHTLVVIGRLGKSAECLQPAGILEGELGAVERRRDRQGEKPLIERAGARVFGAGLAERDDHGRGVVEREGGVVAGGKALDMGEKSVGRRGISAEPLEHQRDQQRCGLAGREVDTVRGAREQFVRRRDRPFEHRGIDGLARGLEPFAIALAQDRLEQQRVERREIGVCGEPRCEKLEDARRERRLLPDQRQQRVARRILAAGGVVDAVLQDRGGRIERGLRLLGHRGALPGGQRVEHLLRPREIARDDFVDGAEVSRFILLCGIGLGADIAAARHLGELCPGGLDIALGHRELGDAVFHSGLHARFMVIELAEVGDRAVDHLSAARV